MATLGRFAWLMSSGWIVWAAALGSACDASAKADAEASVEIPPSTLSPAEAALGCKALIDAYCSRLTTCDPSYVLVDYGDPARCNEYNQRLCETDFLLPGTKLTQAEMAACGDTIAAMTCEEYDMRGGWNACGFKGAGQDGAPCVLGSQCASGACPGGTAVKCSKCAAKVTKSAGEDCTADNDCESGLRCSPSYVCAAPVKAGESCDDTKPCGNWLTCEGGKCESAGHLGEPCGDNYSCISMELACDDYNCVSYTVASEGESCDVEGEAIACKGGRCDLSTGKCATSGEVGMPCVNGACLGPSGCLNGTCVIFSTDIDPCKG